MLSYYDYDPKSEFFLPINITMYNHFVDMLYNGDGTRVIPASNEYAFRKRINSNKTDSTLNLPFMNFKRTNLSYADEWNRWGYNTRVKGLYLSNVGEKVKLTPIRIDFEGAVFSPTERDNFWAWKLIMNDNSARTQFSNRLYYNVLLNNIEVANYAELFYDSIDYDPNWNENDWLVQNKMHSIGLAFHVHTFMTEINSDGVEKFCPTEKILFDFAAQNHQDVDTFEDAFTFAVNQFSEQVICERTGEPVV